MRNVDIDWLHIRASLVEIFGDRQDLQTLQQKIPFLKKGNKSLEEFYREVTELLATMLQKYDLDPRFQVEARGSIFSRIILNDFMRNAFIDGLSSPYNLTVRGQHVTTLEQAKAVAESQFQAEERAKIFFNTTSSSQFNQKYQRKPRIFPQNNPQPIPQPLGNRRAFSANQTYTQPNQVDNQISYPRQNQTGGYRQNAPRANFDQ